jgi:hypothetical protein
MWLVRGVVAVGVFERGVPEPSCSRLAINHTPRPSLLSEMEKVTADNSHRRWILVNDLANSGETQLALEKHQYHPWHTYFIDR